MRILLLIIFLNISVISLYAQNPCTGLGQTPKSALPVCGTATYTQNSVPLCDGRPVATFCTSGLKDVNPFWYKFTCFQSGTLGFVIIPRDSLDDYDWELFDVTNVSDYNQVYGSSTSIPIVAYNWCAPPGPTGASIIGVNPFVCEGNGIDRIPWSKMPNIIQGHTYLLLVSHFTQTQSGYDLVFGGGTSVITDTIQPRLEKAEASCTNILRIKFNKKIRCSSIAPDGSDFFIMPGNISVSRVENINCSAAFDTDSIALYLGALVPGNYTLNIKQGSDGNSVLDFCDNQVSAGNNVAFTVYQEMPTPMDSLAPAVCQTRTLKLIFKKAIQCGSVAADGSDFFITGPYPVNIARIYTVCSGQMNLTTEVALELSQTMFKGGIFTLHLKTGSDGNTILDECQQQTPAGQSVTFTVPDTVSAAFTYKKTYGCAVDTVQFFHNGANGVNNWKWDLDDGMKSALQDPVALYSIFNHKLVMLTVSNGLCSSINSQVIDLDNYFKADFSVAEDNCPTDPVAFANNTKGAYITNYNWSFGDGSTSSIFSPTYKYAPPFTTSSYNVQLTVTDSIGCKSTAQKTIYVYDNCFVTVPTGFTPNNDGKNDFLHPLAAVKADKLEFKIFNRWGQLVFQTKNWKQGWNGKINGVPQPTGVYVWFLTYVDKDTKQSRQMKGTTVLIR